MIRPTLRFNEPADGEWVLAAAGGCYNPLTDYVIAVVRDGETLGGIVYNGFLGAGCAMHSRGSEDNWCSRAFLCAIFYQPFVLWDMKFVYGPVEAANTRAVDINLRLGFRIEHTMHDATRTGGELHWMVMRRHECRWLAYVPRYFRSNIPPVLPSEVA